jgi:hypothetical protein
MAKKVEAILDLQAPKTVKQVHSFLGMVNYYNNMWRHRSHLLAPLLDLTANKGIVPVRTEVLSNGRRFIKKPLTE